MSEYLKVGRYINMNKNYVKYINKLHSASNGFKCNSECFNTGYMSDFRKERENELVKFCEIIKSYGTSKYEENDSPEMP